MTEFADHIDQTVEKIIDEAIDWYMYTKGWFRASKGSSFHHLIEQGWEITPPGKPRDAGGQITHHGAPAEWAFDYGSGTSAASHVYAHFEQTIRDLFYWWRGLPAPSDFDQYINHLADATWAIALTSRGNKVEEVGNAALSAVDFLQKRIGGYDMDGQTILAFDQNFVTPLPRVIHGQYALTLLAGTTLTGEKHIWVKARTDTTAIVDNTLKAMQHRGTSDTISLEVITALVNIAAAFPTPAKGVLTGAGTVLSSLSTLLKEGQPNKPQVEFASDTPEGVIEKAKQALKKLAETVKEREGYLEWQMREAIKTATDPKRWGSFDLPKPQLLGEAKVDEIKVNFETLEFLATETLPKIQRQLETASDNLFFGGLCSEAWYRPYDLGTSDSVTGPFDTWSALVTLAKELTGDTAWEVKESASHLEIASGLNEQNEGQVEEALQRHADKVRSYTGHDGTTNGRNWLAYNR